MKVKNMNIKINQIYQEDCLETLRKIDNQTVDFCIADFPYNISNYSNSLTKRGSNFIKGDFGKWDKWNKIEDYLDWVIKIVKEIQRVLKPLASSLFFFNNRMAGWIAYELERRKILVYKSPIIWEKNNPIPNIRKSGFRSSFEHGVWMINSQVNYTEDSKAIVKSKTFNFLKQSEMKNIMKYNIGQNITKHPTEKPLELIERVINIFTNKDDLVLDLFSGSGNAIIASKYLQRNFISCEIDKKYCFAIKERLRQQKLNI